MKIYWTIKSIPELADLPPQLRKKNFKDAYSAISTHIEHWAGPTIGFICIVFFFRVYDYFLPNQNTFPRCIISTLCVICPGIFIWNQIIIYGIRKHYHHLLEREKTQVIKVIQKG